MLQDTTTFNGSDQATRAFAASLDELDPLRRFRSRFHLPDGEGGRPCIYLAGNSLGLQPVGAAALVNEVLDDWKTLGVEAHFNAAKPWMPYHEFLTESMSRIVGARPEEVVIMNSLTVNLHLLMVSFYRPEQGRNGVLMEQHAFPSDRYAVASQISCHGSNPTDAIYEVAPRAGTDVVATEDVLRLLTDHGNRIALVLLGGVNYYSGQLFEIERITSAARKAGCTVGIDLAHAAGNVPLALHDWDVDFAVWCTYKYLNAGPGGPGGCFVHERHHERFDLCRLAGWWGHDKTTRFEMPESFKPMRGAEGWQVSNPSILSMAALRASLDEFDAAGFERLVTKSRKLTGYLEFLIRERAGDRVDILTPRDPTQRGAQLSLRVENGSKIFERLGARGVVCDWREPDVIRVAPVPLYNSFTDVFDFVECLEEALG